MYMTSGRPREELLADTFATLALAVLLRLDRGSLDGDLAHNLPEMSIPVVFRLVASISGEQLPPAG